MIVKVLIVVTLVATYAIHPLLGLAALAAAGALVMKTRRSMPARPVGNR